MAPKPIVVVTGSSTGIGLQLCLSLARRDYSVVATLRNPSAAPKTLCDSPCDIQPLDVTSDESAEALTAYLQSTYGGCDVLVNNAGWGMPGTLETVEIEEAKRVFDVNVWGVVRICQAVVPLMRERGGGLVMTVSSTSGWRGLPCSDIYTGSKFAIEGMMESFRYSVVKDNVKVCIINPGPTNTLFSKRFQDELGRGTRSDSDVPVLPRLLVQDYVKTLEKRNATGQSAEECAEAIAVILGRELPKRIDDGSDRTTFWNPTSEFGRFVLEHSKCYKDGISGPVYEPVFEESFAVLNKLEKQMKE